jgi:hypothetical protein
MGAQLKNLIKQDILTIDQITMVELNPEKQHPSYDYAKKNFVFNKPVVFVNNKEEIIVDPINQTSIDVQVYHPGTDFKYDRPAWLLFNPRSRYINIVSDLKDYKGFLVQALLPGADPTEIPVDQIVINDQKALILQPGDYLIRIINRQGDLVKEGSLRIK